MAVPAEHRSRGKSGPGRQPGHRHAPGKSRKQRGRGPAPAISRHGTAPAARRRQKPFCWRRCQGSRYNSSGSSASPYRREIGSMLTISHNKATGKNLTYASGSLMESKPCGFLFCKSLGRLHYHRTRGFLNSASLSATIPATYPSPQLTQPARDPAPGQHATHHCCSAAWPGHLCPRRASRRTPGAGAPAPAIQLYPPKGPWKTTVIKHASHGETAAPCSPSPRCCPAPSPGRNHHCQNSGWVPKRAL